MPTVTATRRQDHEGDIQRAYDTVRQFCTQNNLGCTIVHYFEATETERAILQSDNHPEVEPATPMRALARQLEYALIELPNMELGTDSDSYDNTVPGGSYLVAWNVMIMDEAIRDQYDRPKYIDHDMYVARLTTS